LVSRFSQGRIELTNELTTYHCSLDSQSKQVHAQREVTCTVQVHSCHTYMPHDRSAIASTQKNLSVGLKYPVNPQRPAC